MSGLCLHPTACSLAVLVTIEETSEHKDRCHHHVTFSEDRPDHVALRLDWQRIMKPSKRIHASEVPTLWEKAGRAAMPYFQRYAAGELEFAECHAE